MEINTATHPQHYGYTAKRLVNDRYLVRRIGAADPLRPLNNCNRPSAIGAWPLAIGTDDRKTDGLTNARGPTQLQCFFPWIL
jgi:hypothetical protein